jgi:hypothetical protein
LDPIKVVIFVVAFLGLLALARVLSSFGEVHASSLPPPQPMPVDPGDPTAAGDTPDGRRQLPLTGAEFGFPFKLPPVKQLQDGTYNRPNFTDYYFSKTDLVRGPEDPDSFLDELYVKTKYPGNDRPWEYHFTVTTPSGIRRIMEEEKFASLYFAGDIIVVPRWDLAEILHTAVDEITKLYGNKHLEQGEEGAAGESGPARA